MTSLCRDLGGHEYICSLMALVCDGHVGVHWESRGKKHAWKRSHRLGALTVYIPVLSFLLGPGLEVGVTAIISA